MRRIAERHVEALRTDGGHHVRRLADEDDAVAGEVPRDKSLHGEQPPRSQIGDAAELAMGSDLNFGGQLCVRQRHQRRGALRPFHPHEGGAVARHRHGGEGARRLVVLGRDPFMRARMVEARYEGGLVVGPAVGADTRRLTQDRVAPIGRQRHPGAQALAGGGDDANGIGCSLGRSRIGPRQFHPQFLRTGEEGGDQQCEGKVPAEGLFPDFSRIKSDGRRLEQRARVIDQPQLSECRGLVLDLARPEAQMGQKLDRGAHECHRARVFRVAMFTRDECHAPPVQRQKTGCR